MYQFRIQELDAEVGDIVVCVSEVSEMYTTGREYEVEQADDGRLGVRTDCGFIATTSASLFTYLSDYLAQQPEPFKWDLLTSTSRGMRCGELVLIGAGRCNHLRPQHVNDNFPTSKVVCRHAIEEHRIAS
ncbi:hypothetical protein VP5_028 [Vibrio virus VPMCC5]|nr:hypothetical protein VP5_028 [Vibrio virus VPMCC5]